MNTNLQYLAAHLPGQVNGDLKFLAVVYVVCVAIWAISELGLYIKSTLETRHHIDTETFRCDCRKPMCFTCGECSGQCEHGRAK